MMKMKDIDNLILRGVRDIKKTEKENRLKKEMEEIGLLSGQTRRIMLSNNLSEIKLSMKYLILIGISRTLGKEEYDLKPFYNSEIKSKFLNKYPNNTQFSYARIFEKSKQYEEQKGKDLSKFTLDEIEDVLYDLEPLTESASHVNGRIVTAYIDYVSPNKNILKEQSMEWFSKFVDKDIQLYFTDKTIRKIEDDCVNAQDAVIVRLLFEGVQGKSLSEIRNIKKEDVYNAIDNSIEVFDEDGSSRPVTLSDRAFTLLQQAIDQEDYAKKNGHMEDENVGLITNLVDNEYVIRTSITRTDFKNRPVEKMVIYRRIKTIGDTLGYPYLTAKNIVRSGVIYSGKEIIEQSKDKELSKEQYMEICFKYNINNWYPVKKYCNMQMIRKLYENFSNNSYAMV